ncbi:hypothetical protein PMY56_08580 [Clostridium tertium]|jgi:hypothetical protein|uniref:Uncharacterized protein n=1 Tax=Clostridium tertium TaxID=1559 RepID=A0A9X3XGT9_9CLOT|nr:MULTISPECIES: hypothetical protein [Clostridium]EEH99401.1 hypothetical protein CSBG_03027 [Clostridium sp. 7_2_43FAA]MBS5307147.1 hypothetical protein [Clostridium sp.]MBU6136404.1 hypothetical protein [Clostridium tertium]MDB1923041.1 hypothetical protein [Clostridium tertium]MDB1926194.1 hypothetical protein [Clostridium tertium]
MEWNDGLFLSDEEIKVLAIFLAYGVGIGVLVGLFVGNIQLCFALGGVISILVSLIKTFIERVKKSNKIHI